MLVGRNFSSAHAPQGGSFFGCLTVQEVKTQWRSEYGANVGEEEGERSVYKISDRNCGSGYDRFWVVGLGYWSCGKSGVAVRCGAGGVCSLEIDM